MLYKAKVNIHLNQHWNERYQMSGTTKKKKKKHWQVNTGLPKTLTLERIEMLTKYCNYIWSWKPEIKVDIQLIIPTKIGRLF